MRIHLASLALDIAVAVLAVAGACDIDLAAPPPVPSARVLEVARDLAVTCPGARILVDDARCSP